MRECNKASKEGKRMSFTDSYNSLFSSICEVQNSFARLGGAAFCPVVQTQHHMQRICRYPALLSAPFFFGGCNFPSRKELLDARLELLDATSTSSSLSQFTRWLDSISLSDQLCETAEHLCTNIYIYIYIYIYERKIVTKAPLPLPNSLPPLFFHLFLSSAPCVRGKWLMSKSQRMEFFRCNLKRKNPLDFQVSLLIYFWLIRQTINVVQYVQCIQSSSSNLSYKTRWETYLNVY